MKPALGIYVKSHAHKRSYYLETRFVRRVDEHRVWWHELNKEHDPWRVALIDDWNEWAKDAEILTI